MLENDNAAVTEQTKKKFKRLTTKERAMRDINPNAEPCSIGDSFSLWFGRCVTPPVSNSAVKPDEDEAFVHEIVERSFALISGKIQKDEPSSVVQITEDQFAIDEEIANCFDTVDYRVEAKDLKQFYCSKLFSSMKEESFIEKLNDYKQTCSTFNFHKFDYYDQVSRIAAGIMPFDDLTLEQMNLLRNICYFYINEPKFISFPQDFKFVYITSGGGKTTFLKNYERLKDHFVDIDDIIKHHYDDFQLMHLNKLNARNGLFMTCFFRYILYYSAADYRGKIVLLNHPNQVPASMRFGRNELVIFPLQFNWKVRFFSENFFTLMCIRNRAKVFSSYPNYLNVIQLYFGSLDNKRGLWH